MTVRRILYAVSIIFIAGVSALCGGAFLCLADMLGKSVMSPVEIPSGIVTALIGAPYFLYLLRKKDVLGQ